MAGQQYQEPANTQESNMSSKVQDNTNDALGKPDERTSLLAAASSDDHAVGETNDIEIDTKSTVWSVANEFWILLKGSVPVILAYTLQNSLQTVSVLIVGRLGPEALAVSAFCYSEYSKTLIL
jgi:MATE family multidrug resistance protein